MKATNAKNKRGIKTNGIYINIDNQVGGRSKDLHDILLWSPINAQVFIEVYWPIRRYMYHREATK